MNQSKLLKVSARWGLVAGVLTVILLIATFYLGRHPLLVSPFLDYRVFLFATFIFFSLKEFRDYHQQGVLYFWQGLIGCFVLVALASVIGAFGLWVFGSLEPTFVKTYVTQFLEYANTFSSEDIERIGKDVYERNLKELPATNVSALAVTYFVHGMVIGFFVSIILSVILRRT